jgi:hypothetical protein
VHSEGEGDCNYIMKASELKPYFEGFEWPVERDVLISHLAMQGAPDELVVIVNQLPEGRYESIEDIVERLSGVVDHVDGTALIDQAKASISHPHHPVTQLEPGKTYTTGEVSSGSALSKKE